MNTPVKRPAVGFVGLGTMGLPMARHVLAAGTPVHATARRRGSAETLEAQGATWHQSARSMAGQVDAVVFMVPDLPDIRDVLEGPDGLLAGVRRDLLVIICSTVSAEGVRELDVQLRQDTDSRVRVVDAPVSGGEEGAIEASLSIMVGGPAPDAELACDVLAPCGNPVHLGPLGAGQVAKACNQLIVAATVQANGEAAVIAERAGLDLEQLFDLLRGGYAGSRVMDVKAHRFVNHDHSPSGAAKFMVKDLTFATEAAHGSNTATPLLDTLRESFTTLVDDGHGDQDTAVMQAWIESLNRTPHD